MFMARTFHLIITMINVVAECLSGVRCRALNM